MDHQDFVRYSVGDRPDKSIKGKRAKKGPKGDGKQRLQSVGSSSSVETGNLSSGREDEESLVETALREGPRNVTANEMEKISGTSLYLAGIFLIIFNSYMSHQFPNSEDQLVTSPCDHKGSETYQTAVKYSYIVLASSGIMLLLSTAIIAHVLHKRLHRGDPDNFISASWIPTLEKIIYSTVFLGVLCNLVSLALGIVMIHSHKNKAILCLVFPFGIIFVATLVIVWLLER